MLSTAHNFTLSPKWPTLQTLLPLPPTLLPLPPARLHPVLCLPPLRQQPKPQQRFLLPLQQQRRLLRLTPWPLLRTQPQPVAPLRQVPPPARPFLPPPLPSLRPVPPLLPPPRQVVQRLWQAPLLRQRQALQVRPVLQQFLRVHLHKRLQVPQQQQVLLRL